MATNTEAERIIVFKKDDYVLCQGTICIITRINASALGFNTYTVQNIDTGQEYTVAKHCLSKVDVQELNLEKTFDLQCNWDDWTPVTEEILQVTHTEDPGLPASTSTKKKWYVDLSETDIDELEKKRLCPNTDRQTKWGGLTVKR